MSNPRWVRVAALVLILWTGLSACTGTLNQVTETPPAATETVAPEPDGSPTTPAESGGSLIVGLLQEPNSLNPTLAVNPAARWVLSVLDARLVRLREDGTPEAQLLSEVPTLENGGISVDGLTYTLRFRPELAWSDGEPVTAEDFSFTWHTIMDPDYPAASRAGWEQIEAVAVSDDRLTATVTLRQPWAAFMDQVVIGTSNNSAGLLLPSHLLAHVPPAEIPTNPYGMDKHVGTGAFQLVKWEPGEQIVVEGNPHFGGSKALLDRIVFHFLPEAREAVDSVSTGEADLVVRLPEASLADLAQLTNVAVTTTPRAGAVETYAFNLNDPRDLNQPHPIFADPAVREAITLAFNRHAIVANLLQSQTTVGISPLDYSVWAADDLMPYPFDPEKAARLLDEAGWRLGPDGVRVRDGVRLSFTHVSMEGDDPTAALRRQIQEEFVLDMQDVGIEVREQSATREQLAGPTGILATRQFDMIALPGDPPLDPETLAWRFGSEGIPSRADPDGGNVMGYRNATVDRLLTEQARAVSPEERRAALEEIQHCIAEDLPLIPLYARLEIDVAQDYVGGLEPGSMSGLWWNPEAWWVDRKSAVP